MVCNQCDFRSSTNGGLKQHIKSVHDKIKDIICDQCDAKFFRKSHLKQHIKRIHDKIKDHLCGQCDYRCSTKSDLDRHKKICTGGRVGSSGEVHIKKILEEMKIEYEYDSTYVVKDKRLLRWDFIITHGEKKLFIEYDGIQHTRFIQFGGISEDIAKENFEKQIKRDNIKNDFCNGVDRILLRISYLQFENIDELVCDFARKHMNWGVEL
jgi:hypothetical protein